MTGVLNIGCNIKLSVFFFRQYPKRPICFPSIIIVPTTGS